MTLAANEAQGSTFSPFANAKPLEGLAHALSKFLTGLGTVVIEWAWSELILQAGWLPHRTLPPELILDAEDIEEADRRIGGFFRTHWPEIEDDLHRSIYMTDIDEEAKEAFEECLQAHRLGLYRVAPALLFPHIERVARETLLPTSMGASPAPRLSEAVGELGPSEFTMSGVCGLQLYVKLAGHLYKQVRTPDEVAAARLDPVPNRHAVLHGQVSYASEKSSLNMLIMADFIFGAISEINRQSRADIPPVC